MFHRIRYMIGSALITISIGQAAFAQDTLTLERCIELALENNLDVRQSNLQTQASAINYRQTKHNLLPTLGANFGHSYSQGRFINPTTNQYVEENFISGNQSLNSSLVLFDGLRMFRSITEQAYAYRATQLEEQLVKERIALDVTSAYIQVLTSRDIVSQIDSLVQVTHEQVKRNTLLHDEGAISPGDYYDLRGQYASDLNTLNDAQNTLNEALVSLFRLLNMPYDESVRLASLKELPLSATQPSGAEQLYQMALERLGIVKAAEHRIQQASFGLKATRSSYLPSLSLGAGLSSNYSKDGQGSYYDQVQNNLGRSLGFTLSVPILSRFQVRNNVARAKLELRNTEYVAENTRNELQQTANQVMFNRDAAQERYRNLVEQVAHYTESFRIAEVRFNSGDINSVEFLIAKNKMDNANASLVIARYQWHLRQRIVDYYNGELVLETAN